MAELYECVGRECTAVFERGPRIACSESATPEIAHRNAGFDENDVQNSVA